MRVRFPKVDGHIINEEVLLKQSLVSLSSKVAINWQGAE